MTKIFIGGFVLALLSIAVYQTQTSQDVLREGGYDFIVVGSGSSGAVVATRLAESGYSVLLLEAGPEDSKLEIGIPGACDQLQLSEIDWKYEASASEKGDPSAFHRWPRGKVVGGSSSINYMTCFRCELFVRGHSEDYNRWQRQGCDGWGWSDVLPFFIGMESYRGPKSNLRGTNGPVYVEEVGNPLPLTTLVEEAARSIGYNATPDYNSGENMEGFYRFQLNVKNGVRQNTGKTYIKAAKTLPSFTLRTMAHVTRVVFDGIQAVGVAFRDVDASGSPISEEVVVQAKREVILSGGAINTPQLLMLSGIGPKSHLEENGVQVLVDLPGVGENLKDHIIVAEHYLTTENIGIDTFTSKKQLLTQMLKYFVLGTGLAYKSGVEAGMFLRTDKTLSYPDIQVHVLSLLPDTHMAKITNEADLFTDGDFGFILLPTLLHPASTGQIRLKSSNPFAAPRIDPMYYSNETDFATMTRGIKEVRRLAEASALSKFARPGCWPTHHRDIAKSLDVNSDEYIQQIMRLSTKTLYHPMGTAKMGPPEDPLAVVSPQLEVFGTKGLRVVDLSITPSTISGNTNAPAMMIGERAAAFIKSKYGT